MKFPNIKPDSPRLKLVVIGLGHRGRQRALSRIEESSFFSLAAIVEINTATRHEFQTNRPDILTFESVGAFLLYNKACAISSRIPCAYVAVPHDQYESIVPQLLQSRIHVLKEKPAATTLRELDLYQSIAKSMSVRLLTAVQFRYSAFMNSLLASLHLIGSIQFIQGTRRLSIKDVASGWRAKRALAGGGAVLDLGWHLLDIVLTVMGSDRTYTVEYARLFRTRSEEDYDCEDSAHIALLLGPKKGSETTNPVSCNLTITRIGQEECDDILFSGSKGTLFISRGVVRLALNSGKTVFQHQFDSDSLFDHMLGVFANEVVRSSESPEHTSFHAQDLAVSSLVEQIYRSSHVSTAVRSGYNTLSQDAWPIITPDVVDNVLSQIHKTVSIYDNGGIFGEFERAFKDAHAAPGWYALLHNSGTNALYALFYAANLLPGDEVIFPVYTFHATCSPAMHFGIDPIFCDITPDGNIDPEEIAKRISTRTKAVVITHMWGLPCNMSKILAIMHRFPDTLLLEDCSHAHGATVDGQMVGTFGDGAAWSLQGEKVVSGGEGGIVLTRHAEFHYRQLIFGHYNKRCKLEIPKEHPLYEYALTGSGLKNRAHPLAIAIALNQLQQLNKFSDTRSFNAQRLCDRLRSIRFLTVPDITLLHERKCSPAWYAVVVCFKPNLAPPGVDRARFVRLLQSAGLADIDVPVSTGLLHRQPLFTKPEILLPHVFKNTYIPRVYGDFPIAERFYDECFKVPGWVMQADNTIIEQYVDTITKIASRLELAKSNL